jgi:flagellar hook-associated protein 2
MTRQQAIDAVPITALTNQSTDIASEDTALTALNTASAALTTDLTNIGQLSTGLALSATTTDATAVTASITGTTSPATYSITNVTSVASAASETSTTGYADATTATFSQSPTLQMELVAGTQKLTFSLTAATNNLTGAAAEINSLDAGVTATVITTGTGTDDNYLSISANNPGATTLQLIDDPVSGGLNNNVLTATDQGTDSKFDLNNIPVDSPDTAVSGVVPGITLNILGKTAANETVGVTVATDPTAISAALTNLVTDYNTLAEQVNSQIGPSAGLLSGSPIVYQLREAMSALVHYQGGSGSVTNIADLGIGVNADGTLSLDATTFAGLSDSDITSALAFFGSTSTTGLGSLSNNFDAVSNSLTGSIANQLSSDTNSTTQLTAQIATMNAQIAVSEATLLTELEAADSEVANLTSEQNTLSASLSSLQFTSYGYQSQTTASG